jgi:hypothetical protein
VDVVVVVVVVAEEAAGNILLVRVWRARRVVVVSVVSVVRERVWVGGGLEWWMFVFCGTPWGWFGEVEVAPLGMLWGGGVHGMVRLLT